MSIQRRRVVTALAALLTFAAPLAARAEPVRNVVLVHGAWVDGSGWRAVHDILVSKGFHVTEVQEPETSFAADVAATKRILDLQDGPTLLVGHSYGGSVVTEAGVHSKVVGLVYVAAHAPDVGEDEATLGKRTPSGLARTPGAIARTPDGYTYLTPSAFPTLFAPDLSRQQAEFEASSQVPAAAEVFTTPLTAAAWRTKPSWGIVAGSDQIINPELERFYYQRAGSHMTVIKGASHSVYQSHAAEVAAVIESAAREVGSRPIRLTLLLTGYMVSPPKGGLTMTAELRALNARFINNFITNDVPGHDAILHKGFICIAPTGVRVSRADYLKAWATGFDAERIPYYDYRDEKIDVFGDTALVRSTNKRVGLKDGVETVSMTMYTDIYVRDGGAWKCVQAQITPVAPANYPPDETIVRKYVKGKAQP